MSSWDIPELQTPSSAIRISPEVNVPVTKRVKRLIDTSAFRRLSRISQLGLVSLVYPGATHSRMEHSLGVYRNAIEYLQRLSREPQFVDLVCENDVKLLLVGSLLHDVGHWPFCHAIEDMRLPDMPRHETLASRLLLQGELADAIGEDWGLQPSDVAQLLAGTLGRDNNPESPAAESKENRARTLLLSMLSGPIDIDKLDYLERDSLHAGVPYGRNFDRGRLVSSLCYHPDKNKLAITDKGRTAAEMMVFARYVMFSEVYWHHAVRAATAMLQRAAYELRTEPSITHSWIDMNEMQMMQSLYESGSETSWKACVDGLFGPHRKLYKRVAQFDCLSHPLQHAALARKPYGSIAKLSKDMTSIVAQRIGVALGEHDILIDAPPVKLEVQFQLDVRQSDASFRSLGELSPVVHALATRQFDDLVKRVRIFVLPELKPLVSNIDFADLVLQVTHA
jgi:HD superfamily phosphohydrolase